MCKMAFFVFSYFLTNLAFATAPYTCSDYLTDTKSLPIEVVLKQPVVAKFISSFNKITNTNDKSGLGGLTLSIYCLSNGGSVNKEVNIATLNVKELADKINLKNNQTNTYESTSNERYKAIEDWYKNTLPSCNNNAECLRIVTSYKNHSKLCLLNNNQQACTDVDRDKNDWDVMVKNINKNPPVANNSDVMQCLQTVATKVVEKCRELSCPQDILLPLIRNSQQTQCGYSAIAEDKQIDVAPKSFPSSINCTTNSNITGSQNINCIQY